MLRTGTIIDQRYKVLGTLGRGGTGTVYLATEMRTGKKHAIKEIQKGLDVVGERQEILQEIELVQNMNNPHLTKVIGLIETKDSFLIDMDYVNGHSLQTILDKHVPIPQEYVLKWGIQLCEALNCFHSQDPMVVYCDVKPANIILRPSGDVVLIDFGTIRSYGDERQQERPKMGTRGYAAPEQVNGDTLDARTDVYALGATLYHLLTGKRYSYRERESLGDLNASYRGTTLEQVIRTCCRIEPEKRFQNCASLRSALKRISREQARAERSRQRKRRIYQFSVGAIACLVSLFLFFRLGTGKDGVLDWKDFLCAGTFLLGCVLLAGMLFPNQNKKQDAVTKMFPSKNKRKKKAAKNSSDLPAKENSTSSANEGPPTGDLDESLSESGQTVRLSAPQKAFRFEVTEKTMFIHTDVVI